MMGSLLLIALSISSRNRINSPRTSGKFLLNALFTIPSASLRGIRRLVVLVLASALIFKLAGTQTVFAVGTKEKLASQIDLGRTNSQMAADKSATRSCALLGTQDFWYKVQR